MRVGSQSSIPESGITSHAQGRAILNCVQLQSVMDAKALQLERCSDGPQTNFDFNVDSKANGGTEWDSSSNKTPRL